jgi:two-component system, sensor histidine kinase PdtaS
VKGRVNTTSQQQASLQGATRWLQRLKPLAIVAIAVGLAALARWPLDSYWSGQFPYMTFFPAVLVVAMLCGWRYGALTAAIAAVNIYFVHRVPGSEWLLLSSITIFLAANAVMIALAESTRRARARAEAEAASARESEERFTVMADSVPLMIWVHDAQG